MSLHFTAADKNEDDSSTRLNWVRMSFKQDFKDMLSKYGRLPLADTWEIMEKDRELRDQGRLEDTSSSQGGNAVKKEMDALRAALEDKKAALKIRDEMLKTMSNA